MVEVCWGVLRGALCSSTTFSPTIPDDPNAELVATTLPDGPGGITDVDGVNCGLIKSMKSGGESGCLWC